MSPLLPDPNDGEVVTCNIPTQRSGLSGVDLPRLGQTFLEDHAVPLSLKTTPHFGPNLRYAATAEFTFPELTRSHFFLSRGPLNRGAVRVKVSEGESGAENGIARGTILVHYQEAKTLEPAYFNMCVLRKDDGSYGLGVYVSNPCRCECSCTSNASTPRHIEDCRSPRLLTLKSRLSCRD